MVRGWLKQRRKDRLGNRSPAGKGRSFSGLVRGSGHPQEGRREALGRVLADIRGSGASLRPMPAQRLTSAALAALPASLPAWTLHEGTLRREFRFADFSAAFGFMTRVALAAEQLGHHPDWSNVWNRVSITLSTHDLGALSDLDVELARRIDALAP